MFYSKNFGVGMNYKFFSTEVGSGGGKEGLVNISDSDFLREGISGRTSDFFNKKRKEGGTGYNSYKYKFSY